VPPTEGHIKQIGAAHRCEEQDEYPLKEPSVAVLGIIQSVGKDVIKALVRTSLDTKKATGPSPML